MLWAHSDTLPLTTVHDYLDNFFIQALSQVPGVAQASIIGDQKPSIRIQVDPAKLASVGLTLEEIRDKLVRPPATPPKARSSPIRPASPSRPTTRSPRPSRSTTWSWPIATAARCGCATSARP